MRKRFYPALWVASLSLAISASAQQEPCRSYAANSPEDELMQAYTGAENPQDQVAALDKFVQAHANSTFMPCVDGFYAAAYFKLSNFEKAMEYGEKALALNYRNLTMLDNLVSSYLASGKVSDSAFEVIYSTPDEIKAETSPARSTNMSDADWQKAQQDAAAQADEWRQRMTNGFFQLIFRVPDGNKRLTFLDRFAKAFPEAATKSAGPLNFHYALAYAMTNQVDKADEYGEKAIAADPNNIEALNLVAYDYAVVIHNNLDKASTYAEKALNLAQNVKKPEGAPEQQFKVEQRNQMGKAHLTLGYVAFSKGAKTHRLTPAAQELKAAADLLDANPQLQGQALYYLGYAYEVMVNHRAAIDALTTASNLASPWQGQAQDLLTKIKQRTGGK